MYSPREGDVDEDLFRRVFRVLLETGYSFSSLRIKLRDGAFVTGYEMYKSIMRLDEAIKRGVSVSDVKMEVPYDPMWCEKIPPLFKRMPTKEENGQAKIFSISCSLFGDIQKKKVRLMVAGSGEKIGWSYPALAAWLTRRECSGEFCLYDPLGPTFTSIVGSFLLRFEGKVAPEDLKGYTHILDDCGVLSLRSLETREETPISLKVSGVKRTVHEGGEYLLPLVRDSGKIIAQPYYSKQEVRCEIGKKEVPTEIAGVNCYCGDCLRLRAMKLPKDVMPFIYSMGVKPCVAMSGSKMAYFSAMHGRAQYEEETYVFPIDVKMRSHLADYRACVESMRFATVSLGMESFPVDPGKTADETPILATLWKDGKIIKEAFDHHHLPCLIYLGSSDLLSRILKQTSAYAYEFEGLTLISSVYHTGYPSIPSIVLPLGCDAARYKFRWRAKVSHAFLNGQLNEVRHIGTTKQQVGVVELDPTLHSSELAYVHRFHFEQKKHAVIRNPPVVPASSVTMRELDIFYVAPKMRGSRYVADPNGYIETGPYGAADFAAAIGGITFFQGLG